MIMGPAALFLRGPNAGWIPGGAIIYMIFRVKQKIIYIIIL